MKNKHKSVFLGFSINLMILLLEGCLNYESSLPMCYRCVTILLVAIKCIGII